MAGMSESSEPSSPVVPPAAGAAESSAAPAAGLPGIENFVPRKDPAVTARFFAALGNVQRWQMVRILADGRAMSATMVGKVLKRDFDMVSKHLRVLRRAGVVRSQRGEDRRVELFYIDAANRPEPGVLEWGSVRLTVSA